MTNREGRRIVDAWCRRKSLADGKADRNKKEGGREGREGKIKRIFKETKSSVCAHEDRHLNMNSRRDECMHACVEKQKQNKGKSTGK